MTLFPKGALPPLGTKNSEPTEHKVMTMVTKHSVSELLGATMSKSLLKSTLLYRLHILALEEKAFHISC